jgi:predicted nucleic acid-binding Zn ribbon protein
MPEYLYEDPDTGKVITVIQGINEDHSYKKDGKEFNRVFTSPNASIDTQIDPFSKSDFLEKTKGKKGTYGDLWDASKEASKKREEKLGHDPVKSEHFEKYSEKRKGMKHQQDK